MKIEDKTVLSADFADCGHVSALVLYAVVDQPGDDATIAIVDLTPEQLLLWESRRVDGGEEFAP